VKYEIKELSLGQILDQAITLMKNHFGAFFGVVAVTLLPFSLLQAGVNLAIMPEIPLMPTPEEALAIQAAQLEHLPIIIGMTPLSLLANKPRSVSCVRLPMLAGIEPVSALESRSKIVREANEPNSGAIWPLSLPLVSEILVMLQEDDAHLHTNPIHCPPEDDGSSQGSLMYIELLSRLKFQATPVKLDAYTPNCA